MDNTKEYEVNVTNIGDLDDSSSFRIVVENEDEPQAESLAQGLERTMEARDIELELSDGEYVVIQTSSNEIGYLYDRYKSKDDYEEGRDSIDGGLCTGTLLDALEMAGVI